MVGEMLQYTNRLKEIVGCNCPDQVKNVRLANLMTDLESAYGIPATRDEQFEKQKPFVMQLYRAVSEARSI
ncbi:hypothetical protein B0I26_10363 [Anoxybacillus vitaminiphilus]|uniref:Uncharacterized protein n=1 Tax=Paranoxybacillus vitaminiphilus TaxID=581036 RepID=A0A327YKT0_9BACL|nr:hypothetical protein [Anoxybacillus vitaminiphilus]RAK21111.1 hypothetical protein B0I26_10363 [Anoxybacillus vitaminiphilus]